MSSLINKTKKIIDEEQRLKFFLSYINIYFSIEKVSKLTRTQIEQITSVFKLYNNFIFWEFLAFMNMSLITFFELQGKLPFAFQESNSSFHLNASLAYVL